MPESTNNSEMTQNTMGKSSIVAIDRHKYLHCGYCKPLLKKEREHTFLWIHRWKERMN